MGDEFLNIPDDAPVDEEFIKELETDVEQLTKDIFSGKLKEQQVFLESANDMGPGSMSELIQTWMHYCNVGIRALVIATGVKKPKLIRMIAGDIPLPPEAFEKIHECCKKKNPSFFE